MAVILGLDVSTSCTGVCVVDSTVSPDASGSHILVLEAVEFKGCTTLWDKADAISEYLADMDKGLLGAGSTPLHPDRVVLEEPLMGFRPGMSSAQTISTLMRFNGIVSYIARNTFHCEPEYIGSAHARKLCGIKLVRTALGGPQKEQVFKHMAEHDLSHVEWPLKKSGKQVEWSRDACDAYVIARAAAVNGPVRPPAKKARVVLSPEERCTFPKCNRKRMKRGLSMCREHQPFPA